MEKSKILGIISDIFSLLASIAVIAGVYFLSSSLSELSINQNSMYALFQITPPAPTFKYCIGNFTLINDGSNSIYDARVEFVVPNYTTLDIKSKFSSGSVSFSNGTHYTYILKYDEIYPYIQDSIIINLTPNETVEHTPITDICNNIRAFSWSKTDKYREIEIKS